MVAVSLESLTRLRTLWMAQQRQTRMAVVGIVAAVAVAVAISGLLYAIRRTDYSTLFSNLSADDAASIIQRLKDEKVPYALADNGTTIRIPTDMVSEERITLAGAGVVHNNGTGYELFDRMNFGMTEFEEHLDKTRAIEGELQRTISGLTPVSAARVHIAQSDPSIYTDQQQPVTASIAVTTRPGMGLDPSEVRGIVQLVAGAVQGLKPDQVTIVNQDGVMLLPDQSVAGDQASTALRLTQDQLIAKQRYESHLQQNIQSLLDSTVGPKRVAVRVATDMNFDSETTKTDEYAKDPVTRSEQIEKEKYSGSGKHGAGGAVGTASNIGTYQASQSGSGGDYTRSKITRNNEISVVHREHIDAPGKINHTSVAVLVNTAANVPVTPGKPATDTYVLSQSNVAQIRNIVVAAAGLNLSAGDQVSVEAIPFDPAVLADAQPPSDMRFLGIPFWGLILTGGVLVVLVIMGLLLVIRQRNREEPHSESPAPSFQEVSSAPALPVLHEDHTPLALTGPIRTADEISREQMTQYVLAVAHESPENVAKLMKIWISE